MANQVVTRTYRARICNRRCATTSIRSDSPSSEMKISDGLHKSCASVNASKLWNVGRWTTQRIWDACGQIPGANALTAYLKNHERYADLHSQSSSFERLRLS